MPAKRQDEKAREMYNLYIQGFSMEQVAKAFFVTRQCVYKMFNKRAYTLRSKTPLPFIIWKCEKYSLRENGYYALSNKSRFYLHRRVWQSIHGAIPKGYDVHHINGDKTDNRIENLELLSVNEHGKLHEKNNIGFQKNRFKKRNL